MLILSQMDMFSNRRTKVKGFREIYHARIRCPNLSESLFSRCYNNSCSSKYLAINISWHVKLVHSVWIRSASAYLRPLCVSRISLSSCGCCWRWDLCALPTYIGSKWHYVCGACIIAKTFFRACLCVFIIRARLCAKGKHGNTYWNSSHTGTARSLAT